MILSKPPTHIWHFGCSNGRPGHYATAHPTTIPDPFYDEVRKWVESMDGKLHSEQFNVWLTHRFETENQMQVTFIARRDRTTDTRPGSWCGFLIPGFVHIDEAIAMSRAAFPNLRIWQ